MILGFVQGFNGLSAQEYLPFVVGLVLICAVSFWDDIHSLPDSVRLVAQFTAMGLAAWCIINGSRLMVLDWYWLVLIGILFDKDLL